MELVGTQKKKPKPFSVQSMRPCQTPTAAMPGSPVKVDVMEARNEAGETLWHEGDGKDTSDAEILAKLEVGFTRRKRGKGLSRFRD